jgi:hypothetical protein
VRKRKIIVQALGEVDGLEVEEDEEKCMPDIEKVMGKSNRIR